MLPYYIYKLITKLIRPFIAFYILIRVSRGKEDRSRVAERYGITDVERKKGKVIALESANRNYETKIFGPDRVKVQGVLVSLYRNF